MQEEGMQELTAVVQEANRLLGRELWFQAWQYLLENAGAVPKVEEDPKTEYICFGEPMEAALYQQWYKPHKEVVRIEAPVAEYYLALGSALISLKKVAEAKEALAKAILYAPTGLRYRFEYMEALKLEGNMDDYGRMARHCFRLAFRPLDFARCLRNMGYYLVEEKAFDSAAICYLVSKQWEEDSPVADNELRGIRQVIGEELPALTGKNAKAVGEKYNFSCFPNEEVVGLVELLGEHWEHREDRVAAYFLEILLGLTGRAEVKARLEALQQKGGHNS